MKKWTPLFDKSNCSICTHNVMYILNPVEFLYIAHAAIYDLSGKMFKGNPATTKPVVSMTLNTGFEELYKLFRLQN